MKLTNLRIFHLENPIGIDRAPYFSWEMQSKEENVVQVAYQLQVLRGSDVVWDTGRVDSDVSVYVSYQGKQLKSNALHEWHLTVWDNYDNKAQETAAFETAFMNRDEWKARWVEAPFSKGARKPGFGKQPPASMFRKSFPLAKQVESARLYATCHGVYRATINGQRADDREFAPEHTVYEKYLCYQTYDITRMLQSGDNVMGMYVGDGWYCGYNTKPSGKSLKPAHAVLFQIEVKYTDGSEETIVSDQSVVCSTGPVLSSDLFAGELYDANMEKSGWDFASYETAAWKPVKLMNYGYHNLRAQIGEPVRGVLELPVTNTYVSEKGEKIIDFGQVMAGRLRMKVNVPQGTQVTLDYFETPDKEGNYFHNILDTVVGKGCEQRDIYISNGNQSVYEPLFTFHGFRYVRVQGISDIKPEDFTAVVLSSEKQDIGTFECSNEKLNRLYLNTRWSQRSNMLSIPTDCPQREKAGWTGDIQIYATTSLLNEDTTAFLTRWLENLACDQMESGAVPYVVPNVGFYTTLFKLMGLSNKGMPSSAGWGDAAVIVPYSMYKMTGNTDILRQQYSSMKKWCDYLITAAKKGRGKDKSVPKEVDQYLWNTGFHYGEWLIPSVTKDGIGKTSTDSMKTTQIYTAPIFGYYSLSSMAEIARVLGQKADCEYYERLANRMADAICTGVIRPNGDMPVEYMGAYVLPIYFDLVPDKHRQYFADKLIRMIEDNGNCLDTGFLGTPFLLDALCKIGREDKAYELLYQEKCPSWLFAVNNGATSIWESWYTIKDDGNPIPISLNHYAFGCVGDWMFRYITGIDKMEIGFKKIVIRPRPDSSLQYAKRTYHTMYGDVVSNWNRDGGKFDLDVVIPCNTTAVIDLPNGERHEIGSGKYSFSCSNN